MHFDPPLVPARLVRRYKRFLADVIMEDGRSLTVHTPNTGSMRGCAEPGMKIWLRDTASSPGGAKRKYRYSWDASETAAGVIIGVNTHLANPLAVEAIANGLIEELSGYTQLRREVRFGTGSRVDILLEGAAGRCYVEVKNVTAVGAPGEGLFPDAVTSRGQRHLRELVAQVDRGDRAAMLYCVQRADVERLRPAREIDPDYARLLVDAGRRGVEIYACGGQFRPTGIRLERRIPVELDPD